MPSFGVWPAANDNLNIFHFVFRGSFYTVCPPHNGDAAAPMHMFWAPSIPKEKSSELVYKADVHAFCGSMGFWGEYAKLAGSTVLPKFGFSCPTRPFSRTKQILLDFLEKFQDKSRSIVNVVCPVLESFLMPQKIFLCRWFMMKSHIDQSQLFFTPADLKCISCF